MQRFEHARRNLMQLGGDFSEKNVAKGAYQWGTSTVRHFSARIVVYKLAR